LGYVMQTSEVAAQAVTILAPVVSGGARWAQGVAAKTLGDMISERLSRSAEGREAWDGFRSNPHNDSLVRHLLRLEMSQDAAFSAQVAEQLRKAEGEVRNGAVHQSIGNNSSGNVQAGRDISGKVATNGSTILDNVGNTTTTMHNKTSTTHNKKKSSGGAIVGVVAIVVVVVLAVSLPTPPASSSSTRTKTMSAKRWRTSESPMATPNTATRWHCRRFSTSAAGNPTRHSVR
jgi:hypothetical protein